jgi:hypothetical protein
MFEPATQMANNLCFFLGGFPYKKKMMMVVVRALVVVIMPKL